MDYRGLEDRGGGLFFELTIERDGVEAVGEVPEKYAAVESPDSLLWLNPLSGTTCKRRRESAYSSVPIQIQEWEAGQYNGVILTTFHSSFYSRIFLCPLALLRMHASHLLNTSIIYRCENNKK